MYSYNELSGEIPALAVDVEVALRASPIYVVITIRL
jgi:hypothetical protein